MSVRWNKSAYENWLTKERPFLADIPKDSLYDYDYTTIDYDEDSIVLPYVDYYLKVGDWDGLLNLTYIIELDNNGNAYKMHEERLNFILLPADISGKMIRGEKRNLYIGFSLPVERTENLVRSLNEPAIVQELVNEAKKQRILECTKLHDTDEWMKLKTTSVISK